MAQTVSRLGLDAPADSPPDQALCSATVPFDFEKGREGRVHYSLHHEVPRLVARDAWLGEVRR